MCLLVVSISTIVLRAITLRLLGADRLAQGSAFAAPLMPALGVLFAFLSGFAITAMWSSHSSAETAIGQEAASASALAWAATAPGADTASIHGALQRYLASTTTEEWSRLSAIEPSVERLPEDLATLQRTARASASNSEMSSANAAELLGSLDQLAAHRSERISAAVRSMPLALFFGIFVSGLALCLNAQIVSSSGDNRSRLVTSSIIMVVAIDLAVLLILSGPFLGSQRVSAAPLVAVEAKIESGIFTR
jgi:hypothetical protein